jgi:hypothetical protein
VEDDGNFLTGGTRKESGTGLNDSVSVARDC